MSTFSGLDGVGEVGHGSPAAEQGEGDEGLFDWLGLPTNVKLASYAATCGSEEADI